MPFILLFHPPVVCLQRRQAKCLGVPPPPSQLVPPQHSIHQNTRHKSMFKHLNFIFILRFVLWPNWHLSLFQVGSRRRCIAHQKHFKKSKIEKTWLLNTFHRMLLLLGALHVEQHWNMTLCRYLFQEGAWLLHMTQHVLTLRRCQKVLRFTSWHWRFTSADIK